MFSIPSTSLGARPVFRTGMPDAGRGHNRVRMASAPAPSVRTTSALDQALHQFGARLFEAVPGLVTWVLLLAPAWIPIIFPWPGAFVVAGVVLLFDVYWLLRSMTVVTGVYNTLSQMRRDIKRDCLRVDVEQEHPARDHEGA